MTLNMFSLSNSVQEHDEAQKGVIMSTYNKAIYKINHEQSIITVIQNR